MISDRTSIVRKRAESIFCRYRLSVPVDFSTVLQDRKIKLEYMSNPLDIDAFCKLDTEYPTIVLNSEQKNSGRLRFSIAHELGHICIPWHTGIDTCSLDNPFYTFQGQRMINSQELEANTFASELLMPSKWVLEKKRKIPDIAALAETISDEARTSILAGFYAIGNVLSKEEVFIVKNEQWDYYKPFWGANAYSSFVPFPKLLPFLELTCDWKRESTVRSYKIWQYKLFPPPAFENINDFFQKCDCDFTKLLNFLSRGKPIRLLPFLVEIIKSIDDQLGVIINLKNVLYKTFYTDKASIRLPYDADEIERELEQIERDFEIHGRIDFFDSFLFWAKESWKGDVPKSLDVDPCLVLKSIVRENYPNDSIKMLQSINGVMGNINHVYPNASYEVLCHKARMQFEGKAKYEDFVAHPKYLDYISSKVLSLLGKRNTH